MQILVELQLKYFSDENPLKVVVPITDWNGSEWVVSREIPSDVTTLYASGKR